MGETEGEEKALPEYLPSLVSPLPPLSCSPLYWSASIRRVSAPIAPRAPALPEGCGREELYCTATEW